MKMNKRKKTISSETHNESKRIVESNQLIRDLKNCCKYSEKTYIEIQSCLKMLVDKLDIKATYPLYGAKMLHVYRHDVYPIFFRTAHTSFSFEDNSDYEMQNFDCINRLIATLNVESSDYMRSYNKRHIVEGAGIEAEGWNVEMISAIVDGWRYPVKFRIFYIDFDNPKNGVNHEYGIQQVMQIIADNW